MQEANIENKLVVTLPIISQIEQLLSKLHGQYLLHCSDVLVPLFKIHTPYQFQVSNHLGVNQNKNSVPDIYGHYTCLPLKSGSIDIVLTPYLLEYEECPQKIIREFFRILKPNGYLCIVGSHLQSTQHDSFFKTLYSNIRRLSYASILSSCIQKAGGVVIEKKHFFEWPQFKNVSWKEFIQNCVQALAWVVPSRQHTFLIIAQKKEIQIQPIKLKPSLTLLNTVKIHHANR